MTLEVTNIAAIAESSFPESVPQSSCVGKNLSGTFLLMEYERNKDGLSLCTLYAGP